MKKEGIQTRNRKLSSKGKKKKTGAGALGLPDMMKYTDLGKGFGGSVGGSGSGSGSLGLPDMMKYTDMGKGFGSGIGFGPASSHLSTMSSMNAMSAVNHYMHSAGMGQNMGLGHMGGGMGGAFMSVTGSGMHMNAHHPHSMGHGLSLPTSVPMPALGASSLNSMVGAMA